MAEASWAPNAALIYSTAAAQGVAMRAALSAGADCIDLSRVPQVDSAALALLLEAIRSARAESRALRVVGMSPSLESLAELYGVTELLPAA